MAAQAGVPLYMEQLLDELGWNQGTRIPLANEDNQILENLLISKQNEVQRLKEAVILQNQKQADLSKYKGNVQTEYQENTRLLFALKQQLEQEVKLRQMSHTEADRLEHGIHEYSKQSQEICTRVDRLQQSIARLLKKADSMKIEVCGERGALQEWRAALERNACDIDAIKQFTKQDTSKIKALETKRQKLKIEHDRGQQLLNQLVSDLDAEERACERISLQVREGMSQRQDMMKMWTNAVDNLRQRDVDIRHIKEDYEELTAEATQIAEKMREQQGFFEQQSANNQEAEKENAVLNQKLGQMRMAVQDMAAANITLESEDQSLRRELSNMRRILENLHMEGRNIKEMKHRRELNIRDLNDKIRMLKQKLIESMDKSKSAEKRAKELEEILNEEEKFASQLTLNQQRAMHCSFVEQQKLLALRTEDKLFHMKLRASKAVMGKLLSKQAQFEKVLQAQKEGLYCICFQAETLGARVAHMEGAQAEREVSAELVNKENRLKDVYARHAGRVALLERHSARLHDDMRRLARDIEVKGFDHTKLVSNLKTAMLEVDGCNKDLRNLRDLWRKDRVEEALMKLKVAHATRAVTGLDDTAFSLDKQRLQLDAAMNERLVEIAARRDLFAVQRRALFEDCGKLHSEIREREQRIEQLIKRYDIFIASLGKDDSGQQLSVTFFKIKFAAERAELRERGACLDKDISRREADVSALEAALRVLHAAHKHFLHHISPLADDTPEMTEIHELTEKYYKMCDALKTVKPEIEKLQQKVAEQKTSHEEAARLHQMLVKRQSEAEMDLEEAQDRVTKQEVKLNNAREVVKHHAKRAKKLIHGVDEWRIFQLAIWVHDYAEAAQRAMQGLVDTCSGYPDLYKHFGALIALTDIARYITRPQKALGTIMSKLITESAQPISEVGVTIDRTGKGSVFSSSTESVHSGVSLASGYTRRLAAFRRQLSVKVNEPALNEEVIQLARRSTVSLRVVTLGLEDMPASTANLSVSSQSKFFR